MTENKTYFGEYEIIERIARGGMAEVFKAVSTGAGGFKKKVAIKTIHDYYADDRQFIDMFIHEANLASQLHHPNIVQILELGKLENTYYMVLEYVHGPDLRIILKKCFERKETIPVHLCVNIISIIASALDYAHRKTDENGARLNIIHRDVAPSNILISYEGSVKLADFGIAKAEQQTSETRTGVVKGKLNYLSPEQVNGDKLDSRSDIFSLGTLLYELLTNHKTFSGDKETEILDNINIANYKSPLVHIPDIPEDIVSVISGCLVRDREKRFQHSRDVQYELEKYLVSSGRRNLEIELSEYIQNLVSPDDIKFKGRNVSPKYILKNNNQTLQEETDEKELPDQDGETRPEMMIDKIRKTSDRKQKLWKITDFFSKVTK